MSQLELINMGEVARQEVDWLYYPYLPFGKISIVQGDPGEGKTLLMMAIIARLSRGEPLFSEAFGREPIPSPTPGSRTPSRPPGPGS